MSLHTSKQGALPYLARLSELGPIVRALSMVHVAIIFMAPRRSPMRA